MDNVEMKTATYKLNFDGYVVCIVQGQEYLVKEVGTGDSIHSLLSILDFIAVSKNAYDCQG